MYVGVVFLVLYLHMGLIVYSGASVYTWGLLADFGGVVCIRRNCVGVYLHYRCFHAQVCTHMLAVYLGVGIFNVFWGWCLCAWECVGVF